VQERVPFPAHLLVFNARQIWGKQKNNDFSFVTSPALSYKERSSLDPAALRAYEFYPWTFFAFCISKNTTPCHLEVFSASNSSIIL
jgi:hypothetical protein